MATAKMSTLSSGVFKGFQKLSAKVSHILKQLTNSHTTSAIPKHFPSPGLTEADDPQVAIYLHRSSALGGGSRSVV